MKSSLSQSSFSFSRSSCHCQQDALNRLALAICLQVSWKLRWCRPNSLNYQQEIRLNTGTPLNTWPFPVLLLLLRTIWTLQFVTFSDSEETESHAASLCNVIMQRTRNFLTNLTLLKGILKMKGPSRIFDFECGLSKDGKTTYLCIHFPHHWVSNILK